MTTNTPSKSIFEQQREALIGEIAISFESVLQNINQLNRSLEGVIAIGNEFGSVEALWSQFENVMAKVPVEEEGDNKDGDEEEEEGVEEDIKGRAKERGREKN